MLHHDQPGEVARLIEISRVGGNRTSASPRMLPMLDANRARLSTRCAPTFIHIRSHSDGTMAARRCRAACCRPGRRALRVDRPRRSVGARRGEGSGRRTLAAVCPGSGSVSDLGRNDHPCDWPWRRTAKIRRCATGSPMCGRAEPGARRTSMRPGGGRNQRRIRRCAAACGKSANDRPHALRPVSGRAGRLPRCARGVQALSGRRQAGLCAASLGDSDRSGRDDRCMRAEWQSSRIQRDIGSTSLALHALLEEFRDAGGTGAGSHHEQSHAGRRAPVYQAGA